MPYAKRLGIAVVMLLLFGSPRAIALAPQGLQERRCSPALLSGETQARANPPPELSPRLVAQWPQVSQANACACPAITCSELQRSPACQVSCARGKSAYCQCGSCNGIRLSSANVCVCQ